MGHTGIFVTKSDGSTELFQPEKIHKVLFWAVEGLSNVSVSQIETKAQLQLFPGIKTKEIHEILIQAAHELITEETPNYQYVASRLKLFQLRKEVFGEFNPIPLRDIVKRNVEQGYYTKELLNWYTDDEFNQMDAMIKHERDYLYAYAGMAQLCSKYLVQNRVTGQKFETPQIANMLIAATCFHKYPSHTRMRWIKDLYNGLSTFDFSLPTPIMAGLRTPVKQFSSCVLIESDDSLESINRIAAATVNYASKKAGIGINGGAIRAIGSEVRNGDVKHTGITPFYRYFQSALKSCSQGGVRGASATLYAPWWHYEIETIMVLKNNKGTEDDRVRKLDYAILRNKLLFQRYLDNKDITLFSPHDVPDLMDAFYKDQELFKRLYESYEKNPKIRKKTMSAKTWFEQFHTERQETGRLYYANVDHMNDHGSFLPEVKPIKQSNLCVEITLPTVALGKYKSETHVIPLAKVEDFVKETLSCGGEITGVKVTGEDVAISYESNEGRVQLCTLAAYNLGNMRAKEDMERPLTVLVRALNELLDYQEYPQIEAFLATMEHRPLGIGISNLAYFLARNDVKYGTPEALELWDEAMEAFQYYLIKASMELARERGTTCTRFSDTKYSKGIMPIDTYKKAVDELVKPDFKMDWDTLRADVLRYGMMNATLSAQMPVESSALVINATNGIEPPKDLVSEKDNSGVKARQVVPGIHHLKSKYDLLWDQPNCVGYLKMVAVQQKYLDQSISANTFYNPERYYDEVKNPHGKIAMKDLIEHDLLSYKWGIKTGYYCHTFDGATDEVEDKKPTAVSSNQTEDKGACDSGACAV